MDGDITQVDLEYGPSPSSLHSSLITPSSRARCGPDLMSCLPEVRSFSDASGPGGLGGPTIRGITVASPRSNDSAIEEKFSQGERRDSILLPFVPSHHKSKDDMFARVQSPISQPGVNNPHRRDTGLTSQTLDSDPSAKFWNLYLTQAERIDKDHSESWTANTDGVLVFVRQTFLIHSSIAVLTTNALVRRVFSLR
jgi:hypothetical protein